MIKIMGNTGFTFVTPSHYEVTVGEEIIIIGYPLGSFLLGKPGLTKGIVSAYRIVDGYKFIQTDAAITPGNSGGAAIDRDGNCIGIPTAKFLEADNFGLLVPGFDVSNLVQQL